MIPTDSRVVPPVVRPRAPGLRRAGLEAEDEEDDEDEDFDASGGSESSEDEDEDSDAEMIEEEGKCRDVG